jgi:hypothetical protein
MKMTKWRMSLAALIILSFGFGMTWAEEAQMCVPMGDITLSAITGQAKRAEVAFPHALHFSYNCRQCHHKWNNEEAISGCSAAGCHDLAEAPKDENGKPSTDQLRQIRYFKNAYHAMCIGCHKEIQQKNKRLEATQVQSGIKLAATGPTGCIQCHPKEE